MRCTGRTGVPAIDVCRFRLAPPHQIASVSGTSSSLLLLLPPPERGRERPGPATAAAAATVTHTHLINTAARARSPAGPPKHLSCDTCLKICIYTQQRAPAPRRAAANEAAAAAPTNLSVRVRLRLCPSHYTTDTAVMALNSGCPRPAPLKDGQFAASAASVPVGGAALSPRRVLLAE